MSYILNALRKSEKERLSRQPETVTDRILVDQPTPRHRTNKMIALLFISNILIAALFFWFMRKEPENNLNLTEKKTANAETTAKPESAPPARLSQGALKKVEPSIADLAESRKKISQDVKITAPPVLKKPLSKPLATDQASKVQVQAKVEPEPIEKTLPEPPEAIEPVEAIDKKPAAPAGRKSIPFLSELPADYRRSLPDLHINVFVYSEQAEDRFVMIDMEKYKVGQRIKDIITLKEIRSDSLVLEYNDSLFRIKRP